MQELNEKLRPPHLISSSPSNEQLRQSLTRQHTVNDLMKAPSGGLPNVKPPIRMEENPSFNDTNAEFAIETNLRKTSSS